MQQSLNDTPLAQFKWSRVVYPVLFSVGVAAFMLYREYDADKLSKLSFHASSWIWIVACFMGMLLRDIGYIWRMKLLATGELSLRAAFETTLLWEFANTLAPSLTGGTPLVIWLLTKEKMNAGKSTAIVFLTILFDQSFFVVKYANIGVQQGITRGALSFQGNYPNPANTTTNIRIGLKKAADVKVKVYDVTGKVVLSHTFANVSTGANELPLNVETLDAGNYIYSVEADGAIIGSMLQVVK